jgi:hypothetical protein
MYIKDKIEDLVVYLLLHYIKYMQLFCVTISHAKVSAFMYLSSSPRQQIQDIRIYITAKPIYIHFQGLI